MKRPSRQSTDRRKYLTWFAGLAVLFFFLFLILYRAPEPTTTTTTQKQHVEVHPYIKDTTTTTNQVVSTEQNLGQRKIQSSPSKYHEKLPVTSKSQSYEVNDKPQCWVEGCADPSNYFATRPCSDDTATQYNLLGVQSMGRFMNGPYDGLEGYHCNSLVDAFWHFGNATSLDDKCVNAFTNLGLVLIKMGKYDEALSTFEKVIGQAQEFPKINIFKSIALEMKNDRSGALDAGNRAITVHQELRVEYFGLILPSIPANGMREYDASIERPAVVDTLIWKEFGSTTFSNYAQLIPGVQEHFVKNKWIILRKIIPPFPLAAIQLCYHKLIKSGKLALGDPQAKRYTAYNSRCASYMHFTYSDLVRKVVAHNARPSYTYFGGYVVGSALQPHTDRHQCEFTMSLTLQNHPWNETWLLSLGHNPIFHKNDDWPGKNPETMPPESEIVDADLYAGDCLLFMGRHLVHFRRGALGEAHWLNQVFLHYVQQDFTKTLG